MSHSVRLVHRITVLSTLLFVATLLASEGSAARLARADLTVRIAAPAHIAAGTQLQYNVTVRNFGPGRATGVVLRSQLPAGSTFGADLMYTITVRNNGGVEAANVSLSDRFPLRSSYVSASAGAGSCTQSGNLLSCVLGTLAAHSAVQVTLVVRPTVAGSRIVNSASVKSAVRDPKGWNNRRTMRTLVAAA
jgi:uncharacterized repeat protein (TIGR01451 family)